MAERTGTPVSEVKNVIIWGNHSSSQYPDVAHGTVAGKPIKEAVADDAWLSGDFISTVQQRGAAIIKVPAAVALTSSKLPAMSVTCSVDHRTLRSLLDALYTPPVLSREQVVILFLCLTCFAPHLLFRW